MEDFDFDKDIYNVGSKIFHNYYGTFPNALQAAWCNTVKHRRRWSNRSLNDNTFQSAWMESLILASQALNEE